MQSTELKLLGQRIVLRSSTKDPELVRQVMDLVQQKLKEAEKRGKTPAAHQVALLALLDLAEEYVRSKHRVTEFKKQVREKSDHLLDLIETDLKPAP